MDDGAAVKPSLGWSPSLFMAAAGLQGLPAKIRRPSFMGRSASYFDQQAAEAEAESGGLRSAASLRRALAGSFRSSSGSLPATARRTASGDSIRTVSGSLPSDFPRTGSGSIPASRRGSLTEGTHERVSPHTHHTCCGSLIGWMTHYR